MTCCPRTPALSTRTAPPGVLLEVEELRNHTTGRLQRSHGGHGAQTGSGPDGLADPEMALDTQQLSAA